MNVFDFDKTIFYRDSTVEFWKYCVGRKKSLLLLLPKQGFYGVLYGLHVIPLKKFKEKFFCFLKHIDAEKYAEDFWERNLSHVMPWFYDAREEGDWVVSASPEFLLRPVCKTLGMRLLATRMDPKTGAIEGENCKREEKVKRLAEAGVTEWQRAYSDSLSDTPILERAECGFLVDNRKGTVLEWSSRKD